MSKNMLFRFSLYGFLKNQRYYEPFLILAFRDKGLSFFYIGLLVGFRQIWVNILEIPSGFLADNFGRRKSLIGSFSAYIVSFIIFASAESLTLLFGAMFFFAVGEAFRSGTHKAMIFDWLAEQGRTNEKTKYYGFTRSWSQIGSAVSVIIASAAVILTRNYVFIFWISILPYIANIINFLGYPSWLDGEINKNRKENSHITLKELITDFTETIKTTFKNRKLRKLFAESMVFKGNTTLSKEYLQPTLKRAALTLPVLTVLSHESRTALLIGAMYFLLYIFSSAASRNSHKIMRKMGTPEKASVFLWMLYIGLYLSAALLLFFKLKTAAAFSFVFLLIILNIWRPILMSRIDEVSDSKTGATVLSIDSQASSLFVMISAPLIGLAVDHFGLWVSAAYALATGIAVSLLTHGRKSAETE
jgi:MFS family permease